MTSKGYKLWRNRIDAGVITHFQAVQFCHAIATQAEGYEKRGKATSVTVEEADDLVQQLFANPPLVCEPAAKIGRTWLTRYAHRSFGMPDLEYDKIIDFRFVGYYIHTTNERWGHATIGPKYEARWENGSRFTYAPQPWQRGAVKEDRHQTWFLYEEKVAV